jgi:hypothetical protein
MFGSYIGEVIKKSHGAEGGIVSLGDDKYPGLRFESGDTFWQWARAFNRITEGSENNVLHYYNILVEKGGP